MSNSNRSYGGGRPREQTLDDIWPGYLKDGYFDESGNIRLEYVSRDTMGPLAKAMADAHPALSNHQLRRYFGHCRNIELRLRDSAAQWASVAPDFAKLDIAAADAISKDPKKIPEIYNRFIQLNVAAVKNKKDFIDGFIRHFEALVGFGKFTNDRGR